MSLQPSSKVIQKVVANESEVINELCSLIHTLSDREIERKGAFYLGVSGGSMAKFVCEGLPKHKIDLSKWKIFFCDERLVSIDSPDSTLKLYLDGLVGITSLKEDQFVVANTALNVKDAAIDYEKKIRTVFPDCKWPTFDLLLLGMGPDGHTASLFPGHSLLNENECWIAPISDSPKPPPCRVTMTLPVLNAARACVFAMVGQGKAAMLKRVLSGDRTLPSSLIAPRGGELYWLMDKAAASLL